MKTYKWGIVGTGNIAEYYSMGLEMLPNAEIYAVCSRTQERGEQYSARHGGNVRVYTDVAEMCADKEIDAVYVAVPHTGHLEASLIALEAGKHVLCEKPMSLNAKMAGKAIALAKEKGVFFMEAMWSAFLPAVRKAREWIAEGKIGRITNVDSDFHIAKQDAPPDGRLMDPSLGGGALLDLGVYPIFSANMLFDETPEIKHTSVEFSKTGIDMTSTTVLDYGGKTATISFGFEKASCKTVISGEHGFIVLPNFNGAHYAALFRGAELRESFSEPYRCGLMYEARHVMQCLDEGLTESPDYPLSMTMRELEICDRLRAEWGFVYPDEEE